VNYSGTKFDVRVERDVLLIGDVDAWNILSLKPSQNIKMVAFESVNTIINNGSNPWKKSTGLLSIWILGMFNSSPATTVVVPIKPGPENQLGKPVNADYFGAVPPERLIIKGNAAFFSGDSKYRSKIGINSKRAQPILGSYDAGNKVLTLVQYTLQKGRTDYVNSMWEIQKDPYAGDVVNSYNDGPPAPSAKQLGAFYELETSSPAVELSPREKLEHRHRTFHLVGAEQDLDMIAKTLLSVGLKEITTALPR
jgi:hypothetical protein